MSAPTSTAPTLVTGCRVRAARVSFCDRADAEMFLEWLRVRSVALGTDVKFPLFACTAADAYSVSSALTCAVFGDLEVDTLPGSVAASVMAASLPAVLGPLENADGADVVFAISRR